jgi:hypothetical protein
MSIQYLSEIWVVGRDAYATYAKAIREHPDSEPISVAYRDVQWPIVYTNGPEAGPVSYRRPEPEESLREVLERAWEAWSNANE